MNEPPSNVLTVDELQRLLRAADPAALLVSPRILRRVIKKDRGLSGPGLQVPHRKSYVIARERLLSIADRAELGLETWPRTAVDAAALSASRQATPGGCATARRPC